MNLYKIRSLSLFADNVVPPAFGVTELVVFPYVRDSGESYYLTKISCACAAVISGGAAMMHADAFFTLSEAPIQNAFLDQFRNASIANGILVSGSSFDAWTGAFKIKPGQQYTIQIVAEQPAAPIVTDLFQMGINLTVEME